MRSLQATIILCAAFMAAACSENRPATPSVTNAASSTVPAASTTPSYSATSSPSPDATLVVSGPIIVEHQLDLTAQRDGVLTKVFFDASAHVKAGALLAQMDDRQLESNLEAARAKSRGIAADIKNWQSEAEVLDADYARAKRLWGLGLISEEQLQHAKYKAESDQWDIKRVQESLNTAHEEERSLELELEKTRIRSPFDGLVARRYVREGQSVAKGERLFWVTAESPLLMRFTLPEKFFGRLHAGQQLEITCADAPAEKHISHVKQISPVVDPSSGTFEVLVEIAGERGALRPGMTASVRLENSR